MILVLSPSLTTAQTIQKESKLDLNSCVSFSRHISFWGWDFPRVEKALDIPVLSKIPKLGAIALFNYQPDGHSAVIVSISTSTYDVLEANFKAGQITRRTLPLNGDKKLRGFYWK